MEVPSRFTHDVVRAGDKVFVCDTGNGRILEYSFPSMELVRLEGGLWGSVLLLGGGLRSTLAMGAS